MAQILVADYFDTNLLVLLLDEAIQSLLAKESQVDIDQLLDPLLRYMRLVCAFLQGCSGGEE